MNRTFRLACPEDAAALVKIYAPYVENTSITFEYETPTVAEFEHRIRKVTEYFPWIVCEDAGVPVGYAYACFAFSRAAYQWDAELSVYLKPEYHRQKIASHLEHMICMLLEKQGFFHLYSRVTVPNDASIAFHKACGFREIGVYRNTGFKLGQWHDVIALEKDLAVCFPEKEPHPTIPLHLLDGNWVKKVFQIE